jgi:type I restriction enzyme S subunit
VRVGNLCSVVRGGSPRPAGDPKYYGGKIPFLKVADITGDTQPYLKDYKYTIKEVGLTKTRLVGANTLLISNSGATLGVPKICLIQATFNDGIAAFLGIDEESLLFHYYFWLSKTEQLRNINQGAAQPNLNTDIIADITLPLCSRTEQLGIVQEIESRLSVCDKIEQTIEDSLKKAEALRQSILKKAFAGKLTKDWRKKHPELIAGENSAEKLLEKIKAEKALSTANRKKSRLKKTKIKVKQ